MRQGSLISPLHFCVGAMAIAGLLYGFDVSVLAGAILYLDADFGLSSNAEEWVVSAVLLGATIGAFIGGIVADHYGRRAALIVLAITAVIGTVIVVLAPGVVLIVVGRVVQGLAVGAASVCGPLYIAEVAPSRSRGLLVGTYSLAIQVGVLLGYVVGVAFSSGGDWRLMLGLGAVPAVGLAAVVPFLPESPRWLLARDRPDKARRVLEQLHEKAAVEHEMAAMQQQIAQPTSHWADLWAPGLALAMVLGVGLAVLRSITGIAIALLYAPTLLDEAGHESDVVDILAAVGVGVMLVVMAIVAMFLVDRLGRRPMLLAGIAIMTASLGLLGLAFAVLPASGLLAWTAVVCLIGIAAGFSLGPGPIIFLLLSEIYPRQVRARAMGVALLATWASFWLSAGLFLSSVDALGMAGSLWLHAAIGVGALVFVYLLAPETKGKGLEEIEAAMHHGRRVG